MKFVIDTPRDIRHYIKKLRFIQKDNRIVVRLDYGIKLREVHRTSQSYFLLFGVLAEVFEYKEVYKNMDLLMDLKQEIKSLLRERKNYLMSDLSFMVLAELLCDFKGSDNLRIKYADYFL